MLSLMKSRVNMRGGKVQQDRMIKDKLRSLRSSFRASYQRADVRLLDQEKTVPALINPDKNKFDYDDKVISVEFNQGFECGTVFEWENTNSKWLIYLQDLTELAYFRGSIRKCKYSITWIDEEGERHNTYAAIRGPVETKIVSLLAKNETIDKPNFTLHIYVPKNKHTLKIFRRYSRFYLTGLAENEQNICWEVTTVDSISTPGIIELTAIEFYQNDITDNLEEGVADEYPILEKIEEEKKESLIKGKVFIKPQFSYEYEYIGDEISEWSYDNNLPISAVVNNDKITIIWEKTYSGQFDLRYGNATKTIVVESLF